MKRMVSLCSFALVLTALLVSGAGASAIMEHPNTINPGDTIYVDLWEFDDGCSFGMTIRDAVAECEGGRFEISTDHFFIPCTLEDIRIEVRADNAESIGLACKGGNEACDLSVEGNSMQVDSIDGMRGMYQYIKIYGASQDDTVNVDLAVEGTIEEVNEENPATFSFEIPGLTDGLVGISVMLDGTVWEKEIRVQSAPLTPAGRTADLMLTVENLDCSAFAKDQLCAQLASAKEAFEDGETKDALRDLKFFQLMVRFMETGGVLDFIEADVIDKGVGYIIHEVNVEK